MKYFRNLQLESRDITRFGGWSWENKQKFDTKDHKMLTHDSNSIQSVFWIAPIKTF